MALSDSRIKVFTHPNGKNKGVSATRNLGLSKATGNFIALLDSDDIWSNTKLELQLNIFNKHSEVGLVYAQLETLFEVENVAFPRLCGTGIEGVDTGIFNKMVYDKVWMPNSSVIFRKDVISKVGLFNEKLKYQIEDHLFFTQVAYFYPCYFIQEIVGLYRMHDSSYLYNTKWQNSFYEFLYNLLIDRNISSKKVVIKAIFSRLKGRVKKVLTIK